MPIYELLGEDGIVVRLTFFLEKDDYYGGEHFSDRVCLTGQFYANGRIPCGSIPIK
jgi:hypothetical protein